MFVKFLRLAATALVTAFVLSMAAAYIMQTSNANSQMRDELGLLLDDVEMLFLDNDAELSQIRSEMDKEYLEKARAFAEMIKLNPEVIEDFDELCAIQEKLGVDELHICDENGILQWGTIEGYYGYDFSSAEQTIPFLDAITNPDFELAQDPQPNGATGMYFQYIGVSRYDKPGIVQIGMRPERLEEALSKASPANMLDVIKLNQDTRILIIDPNENIIEGDSRQTLEETDSGISAGFISEGYGFANMEGTAVFWSARMIDGKLAAAIVTQDSMYSARNQSLLVVGVTNLLIFMILLAVIATLVSRQFVSPINSVSGSLDTIGAGNFDIQVSVHKSKEFSNLSNGINKMIDNIKNMLTESSDVNLMLKGVVEEIERNVSSIETATSGLFDESKNLSDSASDQSHAIDMISDVLKEVSSNSKNNAENADEASKVSYEALSNADEGSRKMVEMVNAVRDIDKSSNDISKVIKTIDDIAFQTNILALNAAVEAARAGDAGKGFSVVAGEVRNLATKSAEAAKQTAELITTSIEKAQFGVKIANETSEKISEVVDKINKSASIMSAISEMSMKMIESVERLSENMNTIIKNISVTTASAAKITDESEKLRNNSNNMSGLLRKMN